MALAAAVLATPIDALAVTIRFDYRFDEGHISQHPERRKTLELAAEIWGALLPDRFERIRPGTMMRFNHPNTGKPLSVPMPEHGADVLVFIFPRPDGKASAAPLLGGIDGYSDGRSAFTKAKQPRGKPVHSLYQRANGIPYQPWAGWMRINFAGARPWFYAQSLDRVDDIPSATHWDLLSTALHELGHILGFYRDPSPFGFTDLVANDQFAGPRAVSLDGRPIPLDEDSGHIGDYNSATWKGRLILARPHLQQYLMAGAPHPVQGLRLYPTELDLVMLEDIGYTVDWAQFRRSPYVSEFPRPQAHKPHSLVGLWEFRKASDLNRADVGYPLLYMPASSGIIEGTFRDDHVHVPYRAFLYCDHGMAANGGGRNVNQYTVAFDIRLPKLGVEYALLNTSPHGNGPGDVWISPTGKVGQGSYSKQTLNANVWYRIVFSADLTKGERKYYVDGRLVHRQTGEKIDGRFSLKVPDKPFFTLFADSKGEASPIDVQQVALWNYAMPDSAISALGGPTLRISAAPGGGGKD
ncbi:MAG: hypothetical protein JOZ79_04815 [Sphingomonas sp.]|nr:hypothetical protein [Sphingomonas sp.]